MRLTWPARTPIRSFYDPNSHRLAIISDMVDDEVEGRVYGDRLAITFSTAGEFRDLELVPGPAQTGSPDFEIAESLPVEGSIVVWVPESEEPALEKHPGSTAVTLTLLPAAPERWVELSASGLLLGLVDDDVLAAIRVNPEVDPDGESEARWLDSLGA